MSDAGSTNASRELDRVTEELLRRNRELSVLSGVARAAATADTIQRAAEEALGLLVPHASASSGVMMRVDRGKLVTLAALGPDHEALGGLLAHHLDALGAGAKLGGFAFDDGREALGVGLFVDGKMRGLLALSARGGAAFSAAEQSLLRASGDVLAGALAGALRYEAMRAQQAEYVQMRDHLPVIVYRRVMDDPTQSYASSGLERILGYTKEEATRPDFAPEVIHEPGELPFVEEVKAHLATGAAIPWQDVVVRHKDGRLLTLSVTVHPVLDEHGRLSAIDAVGVDVTAARAAQRQLVTSDRLAALGLLAAGVGHEINNPAAFISLGVQQVARIARAIRETGNAAAHLDRLDAVLADMDEGVRRISSIVGELRAFSRSPESVGGQADINALVRSAAALVEVELRARARIEMKLGDIPLQPGSYQRLSQVFLNLLINAAQAIAPGTPKQHRVTLETALDDGRIRIEVRDTGPGIPPEVLPRIFDPFFTTKPPGEGTGLGLAISFDLVKRLGGELSVQTVVGKGTTFTVRVPALASPERDPLQATVPGPRRRILVVDDERALANVMATEIRRRHEVEIALWGDDAIARLEEGWFDLVLCDLRMPGTSGRDVFRRVRERAPEQAARFVFITGAAAAPEEARFLASAGRPVVEKPFAASELWSTIEAVIGADR